ncbi:MAG: hypothetical protein IKH13_00420, partial [Clostridia bacterium]|nr:hypothetical protein [Clostridia bacterium]
MKEVKYADGENTSLAREDFFSFDYTDYDVPEIEHMNEFDNIKLFRDAVLSRACELGFSGEDDKALIGFILDLCKKSNADISRQTVTNWLTEGAPSGDVRCRENVYKLCFALQFDEKSTERFFIKAYLEKPFNYKNINESVYYYCLKNGLNYNNAERIINQIQNTPDADNPFPDNDTVVIGSAIESIKSEKDLVRYLVENRDGFKN